MKITLDIEDSLLRDAKEACGAMTDTEALHLGLRALVQHAAYQRLAALAGSEPDTRDVPRRREKPSRKHTRRS
jgi:Arc/MetJ family transcription regulator